ncbi:DUF6478 family protein [Aliiroseovarius sediminis]|uniref:DUF6478 family protein n=1 Tax=Aliiroseovarius sediminis TaxID=2925839 RepID=UPI001F567EFD|nr:DUF6478 family protein [uncultured Aliiroseovarius sp.]MCI2395515.1 DUF6478 family protein [Aliiroseovarius sediminis]
MNGILDKWRQRSALQRWQSALQQAQTLDLTTLRAMRSQARQLRLALDRVLHVADGRLTLPMVGSDAIQRPLHSDWVCRPEIWRGPLSPPGKTSVDNKTTFGAEAAIFHDCPWSEVTIRQVRNTREGDLAPFGLRLDVLGFEGSFLSLVLNLPDAAVEGLKRNHLVRLCALVEAERPVNMFARLNVQHGPNTEQITRGLPAEGGEAVVEFDLAYTNLNEKRVDRMWVDLMFENPGMSQVTLRDITFSRRPRAEV